MLAEIGGAGQALLVDQTPTPGLYESLLTERLETLLESLPAESLVSDIHPLANAEAADRISRHVATLLMRVIEALPEQTRAEDAVRLAATILRSVELPAARVLRLDTDIPLEPGQVLASILPRLPDGSPAVIDRPLTPLLDTTVLTNAPGEPAVAHEVRAEVPSADNIDVLMAFIRWSGVRNLFEVLRRHCEAGKPLRILTTTYTNSTQKQALDELRRIGAEIRVSYDTSVTRLHAKAWIFHRISGYSTAYLGSSNLTHSAQVTGLEWNVRLSEARNPDAVSKMTAVFTSYWENGDFVPYDPIQFAERTAVPESSLGLVLSPVEVILRPFQEALLEQIALSRHQGHHKNLLVAATGTGKTVMAAVDYARLRSSLPRDRLLFVAHREEILEQSHNTFKQILRDAAFGERWVGHHRPTRFEHVFASIQSLNVRGVDAIDPSHFDVVIVDEFHHAAAPSYDALLEHLTPHELLGLTATPERSDGMDVLGYFSGRIAAELRLWDAIDQQYLAPFDYLGINDGMDLTEVPWKRGSGYDIEALTNLFTANHMWARKVIEQVRRKIADPGSMRGLGFCVSVKHARFMAETFHNAGIRAVAIWGDSQTEQRREALRDLGRGDVSIIFTVDLFNEGIDVPNIDTLLMLRPTESPTLFLQQLGRGLRRSEGKSSCTVLDFVGQHRKEFRYDRKLRALLGGSRRYVERQVEQGFPFLPAGCNLELDPVAQEIVLNSLRNALPNTWKDKCRELRSLRDASQGDVLLGEFLDETGLDLDDIYTGNHSWSEMRRAAGLPTLSPGPAETALLRAVGRLTHVDDEERIAAYQGIVRNAVPPDVLASDERNRRFLRMLATSLTAAATNVPLGESVSHLWEHPQVLAEVSDLLEVLSSRIGRLHPRLNMPNAIPLRVHARYTRLEILSAFDAGGAATWQSGVRYVRDPSTDLFAFTLDKSGGGFSPTTRYRDYAINRELIHWESQGTTSVDGETGRRYINHGNLNSTILLFARLHPGDRAFWCLGTAHYQSHENDRPIAFVWRLDNPLPADLYTSFAAAVA